MTYGTLPFCIYLLSLISLSHICNLLQLFFVENLDFSDVRLYEALADECRKGSDAVARCHVGNVCQVFSAQAAIQGAVVFCQPVGVEQKQECLGKAGTYMLLGEVHCAIIQLSDFYAQVFDEVMTNVEAFLQQLHQYCDGEGSYHAIV